MGCSARYLPVLILACGACAASAETQVIPLPPVDRAPWPANTISHPGSPGELPQTFFDTPAIDHLLRPTGRDFSQPVVSNLAGDSRDPHSEADPDWPRDARSGMFQKLIFTSAYLGSGGRNGLGLAELDLRTILALPIPSRKAPLLITPGFGAYLLEWPRSPDLPSQLYDAYLQFRWMCRIHPSLATDLAITPGVYSDFEQGSDEAIRLPGHGALLWTWSPEWKALAGCAYLDRLETNILPIGGLIWTPNADTKYDIVFPKPKFAHRIRPRAAGAEDVEDWLYLSGEFGGSAWAVRRASGATDVVDYRDWRILLGVERKAIGDLDYYFEAGYIFSRKFQYASSDMQFEPDDTFMVRIGATY